MENKIETFTIEFFKNIGSTINEKNGVYTINNIPTSFTRAYGKEEPYNLTFKETTKGAAHITKEHTLFQEIIRYLRENAKTTLLKIDFDVDPIKKIRNTIELHNCEISNVTKKNKNSFFSRFTFMSTFNYLNESEKILKEIYIHKKEIVQGDLSGYHVVEGTQSEASGEHIEQDYMIAKENLKEQLKEKTKEIGDKLKKKLEKEIQRIQKHYTNLIQELGGDLQKQLDKVREIETQLRTANEKETETLRKKLERLQKNLIKIGDDNSKNRILKEQEFTIKDAIHRHSLNIDNTLINTTIIYYPVFCFNLFLKQGNAGRYIELVYDPLLEKVENINCEACKKNITNIHLCTSGHITCETCINKCDDCGNKICNTCHKKTCNTCTKTICKTCIQTCKGCGTYNCKEHLRTDNITGEKRCINCLRPCLRCHGLSEPKYFAEAKDGSKICQKCLGKEKRAGAIKEIFSR